ncbi:MAG: type II toxin-antitoxin system prevent-host-death family antitoxin [Gammaproteobacteria bacterium]|nr:type II toxin-antitoxin system prevent-host-death family antitoxin [Gammaproteobacteria bacterium]
MTTISISELQSNLLKYLNRAQQGDPINVTSEGTLLATVTPPANPASIARIRLEKLAETAVIHDVVSPGGEVWNAMQ